MGKSGWVRTPCCKKQFTPLHKDSCAKIKWTTFLAAFFVSNTINTALKHKFFITVKTQIGLHGGALKEII